MLENVMKDFEREGVDGSILSDLLRRWENRLKDSGALSLEPVENQQEVRAGGMNSSGECGYWHCFGSQVF